MTVGEAPGVQSHSPAALVWGVSVHFLVTVRPGPPALLFPRVGDPLEGDWLNAKVPGCSIACDLGAKDTSPT